MRRVYSFLVSLIFASGCASTQANRPVSAEQLRGIKSVSAAPPKVAVYEVSCRRVDIFKCEDTVGLLSESSDRARTNLTAAISRQFGTAGRFTLKALDLDRSEAAVGQFNTLKTWDEQPESPPLKQLPELEPLRCLPGPSPALAEVAEADALLLTYALDIAKTEELQRNHASAGTLAVLLPGFNFLGIPLALLFPKAWYDLSYAAGKTTIQICLANPRTGEVLWSWLHKSYGRHNLQEATWVDNIVAEAFGAFHKLYLERPTEVTPEPPLWEPREAK